MSVLDRLTKRQRAVYDFIRDKILNRGYGPTVREIARQFDISSPNGVVCHLKALEAKGVIKRHKKDARAIELTREAVDEQRGLPLSGRVAAGAMHEAVEQNERIDFNDFFDKKNLFVLKVHGDSMIDAQIADGDYVVVKKQRTAQPGQMVVASTEDGDSTLKYWFPDKKKKRIRLQPANKSMAPIYVADAKVLGVVVGVVRNLV